MDLVTSRHKCMQLSTNERFGGTRIRTSTQNLGRLLSSPRVAVAAAGVLRQPEPLVGMIFSALQARNAARIAVESISALLAFHDRDIRRISV